MMQQLFVDAKPHLKLFLLFIFMGISSIIMVFLGTLLAIPLFSMSYEGIQEILGEGFRNASSGLIRYFQAFQTTGMFIIPALLGSSMLLCKEESLFRGRHHNYLILIPFLIIILISAIPFIQFLISLNENIHFPEGLSGLKDRLTEMETERLLLSETMLSESRTWSILMNFAVIAILPALGEEFLFRGVLQRLLHNWIGNIHVAIFIAAAIFSAFHLQFFGFLPRLVLGIFFGYLFFWSGNIWLAVLAHFLNNSLALTVIYLSDQKVFQDISLHDSTGLGSMLPIILSIGLTAGCIFLMKKFMKRSVRD
jgi:membrane protease YdiL (CAAX protease family)